MNVFSKYTLIFISGILLVSLVACSTPPREIEIQTVQERLQISQPDRPRPLRLNDISFRVVSASNLEEFVQEYANGQDRAWYLISPRDYEALALNIEELRRYIRQQQEIIVYYENITSR